MGNSTNLTPNTDKKKKNKNFESIRNKIIINQPLKINGQFGLRDTMPMTPLMQKLQSVMPQQQMFPGMGGGMGGGMSPEQMEQLRALQAQDPAAFEEIMRMMQGGSY